MPPGRFNLSATGVKNVFILNNNPGFVDELTFFIIHCNFIEIFLSPCDNTSFRNPLIITLRDFH